MSKIDTRAFGLWWKLAKGWFATQFASINVDLTPVEEKVDEVKEITAKEVTLQQGISQILAAVQSNAGIPTETIPSTTSSQELAPNTLYVFAERSTNLTLTLGSPIVGKANEYHFFVICGSTAPTINFPAGITWNGGSAPTIAVNKTYEVSILNNVAAYFEV